MANDIDNVAFSHTKKNRYSPKLIAFGAVDNETKFAIPGPSFAKKEFFKAGTAYAREGSSGDWVSMLSTESVEILD